MWIQKTIWLNDEYVIKEIRIEIIKLLQSTENENSTYQNLWVTGCPPLPTLIQYTFGIPSQSNNTRTRRIGSHDKGRAHTGGMGISKKPKT
jgi:hypothetical protein